MNKIRFPIINKDKIEKTKNKIKKYKQIAEEYLEIIKKIDKKQINANDFEFLEMNSGILQIELNSFGLGQGRFKRPYGLGTYDDFQFIANFPVLFKNQLDEALTLLSGIKSIISTYIHINEDLVNDNQKLKEFIKKNNRSSNQTRKSIFNKAKIIEIIFLGIYVLSLPLLVEPNTFIIGFIMNLIAAITIFIFSMIKEKDF